MSGFYLVTRGITRHPLFKGHPQRLAVWMWILDNVAWRDTSHDVKGKTIEVPRGSVCASLRAIATDCGVGVQVVRTATARFTTENMINTQATHGKTIISVCNYEKHQFPEKTDNTAPNTRLTQEQHNANTQKKQGNNTTSGEPKGSSGKSSPKRKSSLPDNWQLPKDWGEWALAQGMDEFSIQREAAQFEDHHRSKGSTMADWRRAWQTWVRNSLKWQEGRRGQRAQERPGYTNAGAFGMIPEVG